MSLFRVEVSRGGKKFTRNSRSGVLISYFISSWGDATLLRVSENPLILELSR
jgi:hypothetical protein